MHYCELRSVPRSSHSAPELLRYALDLHVVVAAAPASVSPGRDHDFRVLDAHTEGHHKVWPDEAGNGCQT